MGKTKLQPTFIYLSISLIASVSYLFIIELLLQWLRDLVLSCKIIDYETLLYVETQMHMWTSACVTKPMSGASCSCVKLLYSLQNCVMHLKKIIFFCHHSFMKKVIFNYLNLLICVRKLVCWMRAGGGCMRVGKLSEIP